MRTKLPLALSVAVGLIVASVGSALAAPGGTRATLYDVTTVDYACATGANKGGHHVGSMTVTASASSGYLDLSFTVRHLFPNTSYYLHLATVDVNCDSAYSAILTDANGNDSETLTTVYFPNGASGSHFVWLQGTDGSTYDTLASKVFTIP